MPAKRDTPDTSVPSRIQPKRKAKTKATMADLGCGHKYDDDFWTKFVADQFESKKRSFILLQCPHKEKVFSKKFNMMVDQQCSHKMPYDMFKKYASPAALALAAEVEKTIPSSYPATKLSDFHYHYNDEGRLRHMTTGEPFHFISQNHYDALGDVIITHIQELMMRPGQWARALCINDSLDMGTILPYLKQAIADGYGVIVFNPNENKKLKTPPVRDLKAMWDPKPPKRIAFDPRKDPPAKDPYVRIKGNGSMSAHVAYVWDNFAKKAAAKKIQIVAHSAGGSATVALLESRPDVFDRLLNIAFTDSVHMITPRNSKKVQKFLSEHAINWVQSKKPLDTPDPPSRWPGMERLGDAPCVSAGHPKHEYTSPVAFPSVFKYLHKYMDASE